MIMQNRDKSSIGCRRRLALFVFGLVFLPSFGSAAEVHYLPSDPTPAEVVAAKAAFQQGAAIAMRNADPARFGGILNVDVPSEVPAAGASAANSCLAAVRRTAGGHVQVYTGISVPKSVAIGALSGKSGIQPEQCQASFDNWLQGPADLENDPGPQGWTYITSYTKSATSSNGNSYTFTIDVYRANTTDPSYDYFMAVQNTSAAASQGTYVLLGQLALTPKVGTFSLFDWGPQGITSPTSFDLGGQVPGLTPYTLEWQGSGSEVSANSDQIGDTQASWTWLGVPGATSLSFLDGTVFQATKKTPQLAFNTSFFFSFLGAGGETYPFNTAFSIRVTSPILFAPTELDVVPGGTYSLAVTASPYIDWVIPSIPSWGTLDISAGSGSQTLQFTVAGNAPVGNDDVITLDSDPSYATPSVASGPLQIHVHVLPVLVKTGILMAGGLPWNTTVPTSSADLWDPQTGKIVSTNGPMVAARQAHTATLLNNGQILLAGGYGADGTALDTTEFFDPSTDTFSPGPNMNSAHAVHTATLLNDGSGDVLIAGGVDASGNATADAELYDPSMNSFTKLGNMLHARGEHTATLLNNGNVLFVGGNTGPGGNTAVSEAEIYDPSSQTFSDAGSLQEGRWGHAALLLTDGIQEGQVLVAGGVSAANPAVFTAEIFTVNSGFSSTGDLPNDIGDAYPAAVVMPGGTPVLIGGAPALHNVVAYDATAGTFSTIYTAGLDEGRDHPAAVLIQNTATPYDGKALIAGGVVADSGNSDGTLVELYDPGAQTISSLGRMSTSRSMMTSTAFGSGGGLGSARHPTRPPSPTCCWPRPVSAR